MKIIAGTGHRPDKLPDKKTGYKLPNPTYNYICQQTEKILLELKPTKVISGMALGFDQYLAHVAIKLGIPVLAAVPFDGQESAWPQSSQQLYNSLLKKVSEVVIVSEGGYSAAKMQIRNEFMIDNCDLVLACYNGDSSGGTFNAIAYAKKLGKPIKIIDPNNFKNSPALTAG